MLTRKLHLVQKCYDEDLILLVADKRKFLEILELNLSYRLFKQTLFLRIVRNKNKYWL